MRGCLFCFPGYALNYVEGRLEGCGHSAGGFEDDANGYNEIHRAGIPTL